MADTRHAFVVEWWDPQAELVRKYNLVFYPRDSTVEMVDLKNNRPFLRRSEIAGLSSFQLFIGSVVNVHSRQLKIVDYADVATRKIFETSKSKTITVVTPEGLYAMGDVFQAALNAGLTICRAELMSLDFPAAAAFLDANNQKVSDAAVGALSGETLLAMELQGNDAISKWTEIASRFRGVLSSPNSSASAKEAAVLFDRPRHTTATFNNCSCLIVKPHAIPELGNIINEVNKNFEISALRSFNLDKAAASEFYEVYRNVLPEYHAMVEHTSSGMTVALEVRLRSDKGKDIVNSLREFAGPFDPELARVLRPNTLRAKYGEDRSRNAVHVSDLVEDGLLEVEYFFKILFAQGAGETVSHPNSTYNQSYAPRTGGGVSAHGTVLIH